MITKEFLKSFLKDKATNPMSFREIVFKLKLISPERRKLK